MDEEIQGIPIDPISDTDPVVIGRNGNILIPFKKGQSGNPRGNHKGTKHLSTIMRELLAEDVVATINGQKFKINRAQALMLEKIRLATSSEFDHVRLAAIKDIEDRIEGKPMQTLPPPPDSGEGGVVFYIPNKHSRRKLKTD